MGSMDMDMPGMTTMGSDMSDMGTMAPMHMGPMMMMCFHFRVNEPILFKEWVPGNIVGYVFSCFAVAAIAFSYELIKFFRTKIDNDRTSHDCCDAEIHLTEDTDNGPTRLPFVKTSLTRGQHVASCITYFVQTFGAYCLMMISMTYNVPICLSMLAGHTLAFFLLGPLTADHREENDDCCG